MVLLSQLSCHPSLFAQQVEATCLAMFCLKSTWNVLGSFWTESTLPKVPEAQGIVLGRWGANINSEIPWNLIFHMAWLMKHSLVSTFHLQCDENSTFNNHALYLGLPCCKEDYNGCPNIPSSLIFQRSTKESFFISTQLSSTKLTQNGR